MPIKPTQKKIQQGGLKSNYNHLTVPAGALIEAKNLEFTSDGAIQPRRGFTDYAGGSFPWDANLSGAIDYKGKVLVVQTNGDIQWYDETSEGISTETISDDYDNGYGVIRFAKMNNNLYYTTDEGIKRIDAIDGKPNFAGLKDIRPAAFETRFNPSAFFYEKYELLSTGAPLWLDNNEYVAYKLILGIRDANDNVHLSIPSNRLIVSNTSGGSKAVRVRARISSNLTTDYFIQLYRTDTFSSIGLIDENYRLAIETQITSAQISAKEVVFNDYIPQSLLSTSLYTSANAEGAAQQNDPPPVSKDLAEFAGYMFYASRKNTTYNTVNLGATAASKGDIGLRNFDYTATSTNGSPTITTADTSGIAVGMVITSPTSIFPLGSRVISFVSNTSITLDTNASASTTDTFTFGDYFSVKGYEMYTTEGADFRSDGDDFFVVYTGGTPETNIRDTAESLIATINKRAEAESESLFAYSFSSLPGSIAIVDYGTGYSTTSFNWTTNNNAAFIPQLDTIQSSIERDEQHILYYSKFQQPEAVPVGNTIRVGSHNFPILRLSKLQNSLIIWKGDGVFQLTGVSPDSFRLRVLDPHLRLNFFNSVAVVHNRAYALTDRGVVSVGEDGIRYESQDIYEELFNHTDGFVKPGSFENHTSGHAINDMGLYILQLDDNENPSDNPCYCLDVIRRQWVKWDFGMVDEVLYSFEHNDGKLYFFADSSSKLWRQDDQHQYDTKTFFVQPDILVFDYTNDYIEIAKTTLGSVTPQIGDVVEAVTLGFYTVSQVESVSSGTRWRLHFEEDITSGNFDTGSEGFYQLYSAIETLVGWSPFVGSSISGYKHFDKMTLTFRSNSVDSHNMFYGSDIDGQTDFESQVDPKDPSILPTYTVNVVRTPSGEDAVDTYQVGIPRGVRRSTRLRAAYHVRRARTEFMLEGAECTFIEPSHKTNRRLLP